MRTNQAFPLLKNSSLRRAGLTMFWECQAGASRSIASARLIFAKLDARHDAGEALDKIASLHDLVKAFA